MSMKEPRASRATHDWGVVFQSIPSRYKNEVGKKIEEILGLDKRDVKTILTNAPLVFLDDLSFELAVRIKIYFQKLGVVVEVTSHDIIKKNCSHVSWRKAPDLSFFSADDAKPAVMDPAHNENEKRESVGSLLTRKNSEDFQMTPETQKIYMTPLASKTAAPFEVIAPEPEERSPSDMDAELKMRAQEMGERFRTLHEEKESLQTQHVEAISVLKKEFQRTLDEEKNKNKEVSKACADLKQEIRQFEALAQEDEALRSQNRISVEKVRELEAALLEKTSAVELLAQEKEALVQQSGKEAADIQQELAVLKSREPEWLRKIEGLEQTVQQITAFLRTRDGELAQAENRRLELEALLKEKAVAVETLAQQKEEFVRQTETKLTETHQELATLRNREPELLRTIEGLERAVHQTAGTLHARESELARTGKLLTESEATLKEKTSEIEILARKNEELRVQSGKSASEVQRELSSLRTRELELLRKITGLEQAVQEMTVSGRTRDNALAQFENRLLELAAALKTKTSELNFTIQQKEALDRQSRKTSAEMERDLMLLKSRELDLLKQISGLEMSVKNMTASLQSRDNVLAQFEMQITKLIEMSGSSPKRPPRF